MYKEFSWCYTREITNFYGESKPSIKTNQISTCMKNQIYSMQHPPNNSNVHQRCVSPNAKINFTTSNN